MLTFFLRVLDVALAFTVAPRPGHVPDETCRTTPPVGEAPGAGAADEGQAADGPSHSAPQAAVCPSTPWPACEDAPRWAPHPSWRMELRDDWLAYLLGVWSKEVSSS